ncbi:MAG: hypothetical protein ACE5DM_04240 [Candidatus Nanoarchaeia archaeon]
MKKIICISIMILVLLLTGCKTRDEAVISTNYRMGTEAMKMSFIKNMPTDTIFSGEVFNIGINLENVGAHEILNGKITVSGYERNQYEFEGGNTQKFQLQGKNMFTPAGEQAPVIFNVKSTCFPAMAQQIRTDLKTTFRATACFTYATVASTQVCVDTNPLSSQTAKKKVCDVKAIELSGGQGAPIAVTKIEPSMIPIGNGVKARFLIHLKNLNTKGVVYATDAVQDNCERSDLQNKVLFGARLSNQLMDCTPQGEITLRLGEETLVSCETDLGLAGGVYETDLSVGMEYAYSQDVSKQVTVKKPLDVDIPDCTDVLSK